MLLPIVNVYVSITNQSAGQRPYNCNPFLAQSRKLSSQSNCQMRNVFKLEWDASRIDLLQKSCKSRLLACRNQNAWKVSTAVYGYQWQKTYWNQYEKIHLLYYILVSIKTDPDHFAVKSPLWNFVIYCTSLKRVPLLGQTHSIWPIKRRI